MTITEFANSRGVQSQTVSIYINRHEEMFSGHTKRAGKTVELDEEALEILDKQYPLPKMVEIIEDKESREELIKTQKALIQTQRKMEELRGVVADAEKAVARAEAVQLLLEDKEAQLQKANERLDRLEERPDQKDVLIEKERKNSEDKDAQIKQLMQSLEETRRQLDEEKNSYKKTIFGLFKRK